MPRLPLLAFCVALAVSPCLAADEDRDVCKLMRDELWQATGTLTLAACGQAVAERSDIHESSGVRFGFWGQTLLASTRGALYRSDNGGQSWKPALNAGPRTPPQAASAVGIPALGALAPAASPAPSVPVAMPAPGPDAGPPAAPHLPSRTDAVATASSAPPPAASPSPAPAATSRVLGADRRANCEIKRDNQWQVQPQQTLADCIGLLERRATPEAASGMLRAYWSGMYLAADRRTIYHSEDGRQWAPLQPRSTP